METLLQSTSLTTASSAANLKANGSRGDGVPEELQLAQIGDDALSRFSSLLDLQLDVNVTPVEEARLSPESFPAFDDADLPAPLFLDDDLPAPLFHDDDLSAPSFHDDDMPADLTATRLDDLLGLRLSGSSLPTVGEVVRTAYRDAVPRRDGEPEADEQKDDEESVEEETADAPVDTAQASADAPGDLSFIDPQSLVEKAAEHDEPPVTEEFAASDPLGDSEPLPDSGIGGDEAPPAAFGAAAIHQTASASPDEGDDGNIEVDIEEEEGDSGSKVINGTSGDDFLAGAAGDEILHGFAGDDTLDGGDGVDRLDGGAGDDVLIWDSADLFIDGAGGYDTLRVETDEVDLSEFAGEISRIEAIDLASDSGANELVLTAQDVLSATDASNTLIISGAANDSIDAGGGWAYGGVDGSGNDIYTQDVGPNTATLVIDPAVNVNATILA